MIEPERDKRLPPPFHSSLPQLLREIVQDRRLGQLPPGPPTLSGRELHRLRRDPLAVWMSFYERYGPVFTWHAGMSRWVMLLGPAANQAVLVEYARDFSWRRGGFGALTPLIGDSLITTDGAVHDHARQTMLPAFHRRETDELAAAVTSASSAAVEPWRVGEIVDIYGWARELTLRIAMQTLVGLDAGSDRVRRAAEQFQRALSYYGTNPYFRYLRGPGTPWSRLKAARRALDRIVYGEIAHRRARGRPGPGLLGNLIVARDADGEGFSDRELRDHVVTLLFGGHDNSSSTIAFLLYELARHPDALARIYNEQDRVLGDAPPTADQLAGELPELDLALAETLRRYPPVWVSPRRAERDIELLGHHIPANCFVMLSSYVTHHMPELFADPETFRPQRFAPEARRQLPKGAYIPFGAGERICIGKRLGQTVTKAVVTSVLQRFRPEPHAGHTLSLSFSPTLSPGHELPMALRERGLPAT